MLKRKNKAPLRVLQLGSPTGLYGAERWILALVKHLNPAKVESIVATVKDNSALKVPLCREASKLGVRTKLFKVYGKINLDALRQLQQFIRKEKIDIIHTHQYKQDIIGLIAAMKTGCRVISTPHGWSTHADLKLRCYELLDRCLFPFFDAVVPLSRELQQELSKIPLLKRKLRLIENGVDLTEVDEVMNFAPEIMRWREEGVFLIGYIGQLILRKGLDVLLGHKIIER